jgi:hypothetical protein
LRKHKRFFYSHGWTSGQDIRGAEFLQTQIDGAIGN